MTEHHELWPWHRIGLQAVRAAIARGHRSIVYTTPTGGGKTRVESEIARLTKEKGNRAVILVDRKTITDQQTRTLEASGVWHSIIAAGEENEHDPREAVQLARVQTLDSRIKRGTLSLPDADVVIVDEGHIRRFWPIVEQYKERGAICILFTATPVGIPTDLCTELIVAGTKAELREHGALVRAEGFCPNEPDLKGVKRKSDGDFAADLGEKYWEVYADVFGNWKRLNPFAMPTILFAPDVKSSIWFAGYFNRRGVPAAHIDGSTPDAERADVLGQSKDGKLKVVCSCGVFSYGADFPWMVHGIMCKPYGAIQSWLQEVGRLLRAAPNKERCIIQDHSGAWTRIGDPNDDIEWQLGKTDIEHQRARTHRLKAGKETEDILCPQCSHARKSGPKCPNCGHQHKKSGRTVIMRSGELVKKHGPRVKVPTKHETGQRAWTGCLYAAAKSGRTVAQAAAMYKTKTGEWPRGLSPSLPDDRVDWQRRVTEMYPWLGRVRAKAT